MYTGLDILYTEIHDQLTWCPKKLITNIQLCSHKVDLLLSIEMLFHILFKII